MKKKLFQINKKYYPGLILLLALIVRVIGINWDQGFGLHPDERMIMIVTERINLGNLDPDFFNYGTFPIYLLKLVSSAFGTIIRPDFASYPGILLVGRFISAIVDTGTVWLIYLIAKFIWDRPRGLISALLYALAVFPLQNAHYFTVDTLLTFLFTLVIYLAIRLDLAKLNHLVTIGIVCGLAAATKASGFIVLLIPTVTILLKHFSQFKSDPKQVTGPQVFASVQTIASFITTVIAVTILFFFLTQPYALIKFPQYLSQVSTQMKMSSDATIFPYTYQFIDTPAYVYPLLDIIQWGLGLPLGILAVMSIIMFAMSLPRRFTKLSDNANLAQFSIMFFVVCYFLVLGRSEVKFMRYYLPLYPSILIIAPYALFILRDLLNRANKTVRIATLTTLTVLLLIWPVAFITTYFHPHPRIAATNWINENIPAGSTIAIEHWDDQLPLENLNNFTFEKLEVYNPETTYKWTKIGSQLDRSDYLVISSNRVYGSITNWPERYPDTTRFYDNLFGNKSDFVLLKEFTNYPKIAIAHYPIEFNDDRAQESFTSYDHPKVMVFVKQ